VVVWLLPLRQTGVIVPVVVMVGEGFIVTLTVWVPEQPVAFVMVMIPLYVPAAVDAGIVTPVRVPPPAANANAVVPWSTIPAVVQSILYETGEPVVAVYDKVVDWTLVLKHIAAIIPVVVIVGATQGFNAMRIPPLVVLLANTAEPLPVAPAGDFIAHAAPRPISKLLGLNWTS